MNFEDVQKNWQSQSEPESITIDTNILLKEVQRNKKQFDAIIFWRDAREAGGAFVMMIVFVILSITMDTLSLLFPAAACLFVAVYMLTDRIRFKSKHPHAKQNDTLLEAIEHSIVDINHQIRILKGVMWWYLMPFALGISAFWLWILWQTRGLFWAWVFIAGCFVFLFVVYFGIYQLNQKAVTKELQPRKQELEELLKRISTDLQD